MRTAHSQQLPKNHKICTLNFLSDKWDGEWERQQRVQEIYLINLMVVSSSFWSFRIIEHLKKYKNFIKAQGPEPKEWKKKEQRNASPEKIGGKC